MLLTFGFSIQNTINEWGIIFIIAAIAYIAPALIFIIFGSGKVQPWNEVELTEPDQERKENTTSPQQP